MYVGKELGAVAEYLILHVHNLIPPSFVEVNSAPAISGIMV